MIFLTQDIEEFLFLAIIKLGNVANILTASGIDFIKGMIIQIYSYQMLIEKAIC